MPNAFYFIRLIHGATRKPCPGERMWDAGQLVRGSVVHFLRARNQQGYDIYLLPYAEQCNAGYILIDLDHATADFLPRMRANGLVVNIIILWNTLYINVALERVLSRDDPQSVRQAPIVTGNGVSTFGQILEDRRLSALLLHPRGRKRGSGGLREEQEQIITGQIRKFYLTREKRPVAALHREIATDCGRENFPVPSYGTVLRRLPA
jgi:hypothetical protein